MMRYEIKVYGVFDGPYGSTRKKILEHTFSPTKPNKTTINRLANENNDGKVWYAIAINVKDTESDYEANYII